MSISWGALAGAFLAPFLYGLYMKRTSKAAVWVSYIFGAGIMLLNLLCRSAFPPNLQSPINCGAFAMIAGLILVPIISFITKAPDAALVDSCFACYEEKVLVSAKRALSDKEQ